MDGEEEFPWRTPPASARDAAAGRSSQKRRRANAKKRRRTGASGDGDATGQRRDTEQQGGGEVISSAGAETPAQWGCPACTFLNDAARRFCEMCGTDNPTKPADDRQPAEWSCVACTMKNAPTQRSCAVCGTINPNPTLPAGLSIARHSLHGGLFLDEYDDGQDDSEVDSEERSSEEGGSDSSSEGSDVERRLECPCIECGSMIGAEQSDCPECHAPRPLPRRKLKRSDLATKLHKLTRKIAKHDKKHKDKKSKDGAKESTMKNAYGVSSEVLKKLMEEPKSSKLVDTLQTLTHTLAMMDASADADWGEMHGSGGAAFFVHGFGGRSDKGKDTALLGVLSKIFADDKLVFYSEVRLFAVQSINYLLKMDRHLYKKDEALSVVRLYLKALKAWSCHAQKLENTSSLCGKEDQMIVEECVNGISGLCGSESAMLRELMTPRSLEDYITFVETLARHDTNTFHDTVVTSAVELFQKCCTKIKWGNPHPDGGNTDCVQRSYRVETETVDKILAMRIVDLLRLLVKHKRVAFHVYALKCMLLFFHKMGSRSSLVVDLVTAEMILELIDVFGSDLPEEPEDSRQAAITLVTFLIDTHSSVLGIVTRKKLYNPLLDAVFALTRQASVGGTVITHALKLASILVRRICSVALIRRSPQKPRQSKAGPNTLNRMRLDSSPDPDVLAKLLLDCIRTDSVPAVSALLKDGADLNFPSMLDAHGRELEKPLVLAAECASLAMVRFLVKRGIDIHQMSSSGTALHVAALAGRCDVVSFLLECGASPNDVDNAGRTVIERLNEVERNDETTTSGRLVPSPVRKLLELHQRVHRTEDDSGLSEDDGDHPRGWLVGRNHYEDGEEDFDDDEEDDFLMDYEENEDDEDSDADGSSGDECSDVHAETDQVFQTPEKKDRKRARDGDECMFYDSKKTKTAPTTVNPQKTNPEASEAVTSEEVQSFCEKVLQCLLETVRGAELQNINRAVLSTLASSLEMAPSSLVRRLSDSEISLLLEVVGHLLQDPSVHLHQSLVSPLASGGNDETQASKTANQQTQAFQKKILASYMLAIRLLQAIVRKSMKESSVFYEIERRGICEQIERVHTQASSMFKPPGSPNNSVQAKHPDSIFGRGSQLLEFLRANMVESGMLHLHRLKNMTRRLKEVDECTPITERDTVLSDLVELFEDENAITSHEFKQSNLLEAMLAFLMGGGDSSVNASRVRLLIRHFTLAPSAFVSLVNRLQSVVNQEENLPLVSLPAGKGRELYPLTKQLRIVCTSSDDTRSPDAPLQKVLQLSPLTHFQSFEKTIFRCMPVKDNKLTSLYISLIGHCVQKAVDGKWKKYWVCGFDEDRCTHLLKPVDDASDEVVEAVIHDSQFKLLDAVKVFEEVDIDFKRFGDLTNHETSESKKRKRQSKKRRKSVSEESIPADLKSVEVKNAATVNAGKLRGAWYAGSIVVEDDDANGVNSKTIIQPGGAYTVRLLASGNVLKKVPAEMIRQRTQSPQVGSVVEVDGLLGEVSRIQSKGAGNEEEDVYDVKVSSNRERNGIKKQRIRYPPTGAQSSRPSSSGVIEAMSLNRLFPPRQSSLVAGSVGDHVWIPPTGASADKVMYLAGTIHSFPGGPDASGPSAPVFVSVSFGSKSCVIKVAQDRVVNVSGGRGRLGPSRLLSALQMASERSGALSGPPLQRLLQSASNGSDLFANRPSSTSTLDQLRHLLASREGGLHGISGLTSNGLRGSTSSSGAEGTTSKQVSEDPSSRLARVWGKLCTGNEQTQWKCTKPPKVYVQLGFDKFESLDHAVDDEDEVFGLARRLQKSKKSDDVALTMSDKETNSTILKPKVASALSAIFDHFTPKRVHDIVSKRSKKSKKRKLSMSPSQASDEDCRQVPLWDIDKFSDFMAEAFGMSTYDDPEGTLVDNCIQFSLFALPSTRRSRLDRDGFLALAADMCKNATSSRQLLSFLYARGYNKSSLDVESIVTEGEKSVNKAIASKTAMAKKDIAFMSFSSDQNMLKCLHDLVQQESHQLTPPWKFKYFVKYAMNVEWPTSPKRESSEEISTFYRRSLDEVHGLDKDSLMFKAIRLLHHLYDALPRTQTSSTEVWRNARLTKKLESQLEDVLAVCSGTYPSWCDAVVSECKFFFPRELREKLFRATAFGSTRSLHWFRNQLNMEEGAASANGNSDGLANGGGIGGDGIYNHDISISPIPKERVKVDRENILSSAEAVMKMHGKRKAVLDIVFIGEKGYGSGVTAAFYSAIAEALQSIEENRKDGMHCWVSGIENDREETSIRHPNGLFPFPHFASAPSAKLVERFRTMGRLAGKALMDDRLFPLPLSIHFIKLVLGQQVSADDLDKIFLSPGKIIMTMKSAVDRLESGENAESVLIDGMPMTNWLDAVGFTFIDPLSQTPLEPNGENKDVTLKNVEVYVDKVLSVWLRDGIRAQVQAFRDGIGEILPLEKLKLLFVPELLSMLCGDADIAWNAESLLSTMKLAHGYTKDSMPVKHFVDVLAEMTIPERREFLLYATGCPNLPAGGFAALKPTFEVVRRVVDTDNVDQALPFARTCTNTLHLPAYSSKQVLDERLRFAVANSAGVIDRD